MEADGKEIKTDKAWKRLYTRLENDGLLRNVGEEKRVAVRGMFRPKWWAVAALVIGIVVGVAWWKGMGGEEVQQALLTQENRERPALVKTLEDGSVVYLARASRLTYPAHFAADKREVNLQGEAFFDVVREPEKVFVIDTEQVSVEVLGTAFEVRSDAAKPFSLSVKSGSVQVRLKKSGQTLRVKAGETVTLRTNGLLLSETNQPDVFDRYRKHIRFKDERLGDVLRVINKEFADCRIETSSAALNQRRLTAEFGERSPETVAELICRTFNLRCENNGNKLVLTE